MTVKKVYLNDPVSPKAYDLLKSKVEIVTTYDHPEELDAIIVRQQYVTREVIEKAVNCKLISMHGTGTERIDLEAAKEYGIPVITHAGYNATSVAELAVTQLMACARKLKEIDRGLRQGKYHAFGDAFSNEHEIFNSKVGIIGTGNIACEIARIMRNGFNCTIYGYNNHRTSEELLKRGFIKVTSVNELLSKCDYVVVACVLNDETRNLITKETFKEANKDLVLVNISRGGIINEDDLYEVLVNKQIKAAASDVYAIEPVDKDLPLLHLDNFIGTFHVGGSTVEAMERLGIATVEEVFKVLEI
ncbi:MAG: NAD(P)-binding domain-containing protein [Erysipelotrichaceae bacterium]|nr:NAD(P)-binding domain-containing protein [Erysipelotrichaceae bacterium]